MTTLREASFAFNKDQVRGPDGKWISVGDVVKSVEHGTGKVVSVNKGTGKATVSFEDADSDVGEVRKTVAASTLKKVPRFVPKKGGNPARDANEY